MHLVLLILLIGFAVTSNAQSMYIQKSNFAAPRNVSYDRYAITINGERKLILSGAIHYPRSTPSMWPRLMQFSRNAGLNTIETYVFWHLHEPVQNQYDFTGRLDLARFLSTAAAHELQVILRIGPYICAEINYGGFPEWLKEVEGIQFRTYNKPFMTLMAKWVTKVVDYVRPFLASSGGPIILVQIENEYGSVIDMYGDDGKKYIDWCYEFASSLNVDIPWVMCVGSAGKALDAVNGFFAHDQLDKHWQSHPDQPGIWTENWSGWFNAWGYAQNTRPAIDDSYAVARFFAAGGTAMNYYMWHGGTNFGRTPSYLMTTSYDYDAPLDEYGYPHHPKYGHAVALHKVLLDNSALLLSSYDGRPVPKKITEHVVVYQYTHSDKKISFLCNDHKTESTTVSFEGKTYTLSAWSVQIIDGKGNLLFDTAKPADKPTEKKYSLFAKSLSYQWWEELRPGQHPHSSIIVTTDHPVEYLQHSHDTTDYTWYMRNFILHNQESEITLHSVADIAHVFIDGHYVNSTSFLLKNERGLLNGTGFTQKIQIDDQFLQPGSHEIAILTTCVGMTKLEHEIDQNLADDKRGIWGKVTVGAVDITIGNWTMQLGTIGEFLKIMEYKNTDKVLWNNDVRKQINKPKTWWKTSFKYVKSERPVVIDFSGMKKGIAYINGNCIGRYNVMDTTGHGGFFPLVEKDFGKPVQRYYHVPAEWLQENNYLIFFEELGGNPENVGPAFVIYN